VRSVGFATESAAWEFARQYLAPDGCRYLVLPVVNTRCARLYYDVDESECSMPPRAQLRVAT